MIEGTELKRSGTLCESNTFMEVQYTQKGDQVIADRMRRVSCFIIFIKIVCLVLGNANAHHPFYLNTWLQS